MRKHTILAVWLATVIGLVCAATAGPAPADTGGDEMAVANELNQLRSRLGLPALAIKGELFDLARAWSGQQAAVGAASHNPRLSQQLPSNWIRSGENVASGQEVWTMFDALLASPGHALLMLDPGFNSVGIGIVQTGNGTYYATMVFLTTAPPARAAAPRQPPCRRVRQGRCVLR
ncbi:MAG: CAP domain-containing protein [Acidimicrobiales bacterium]